MLTYYKKLLNKILSLLFWSNTFHSQLTARKEFSNKKKELAREEWRHMPIILVSPQEVEAEAGESLQSGVQPGLHSKTLSSRRK